MKASLDTNVIIHLYRSGKQHILFDLFTEGVFVYEFIVDVELQNHGKDILPLFQKDISDGKVTLITDEFLKGIGVLGLFREYYNEDIVLYTPGDAGEVYAIALARTLDMICVVTDDMKEDGPHKTLMKLPVNEVIPLTFYEVLFMLFLKGEIGESDVVNIFESVIISSHSLVWRFEAKFKDFINRFDKFPYCERESMWMRQFCDTNGIKFKQRIKQLFEYYRKNKKNI